MCKLVQANQLRRDLSCIDNVRRKTQKKMPLQASSGGYDCPPGNAFRIIRTLLGYVSFVVCRCLLWVPGSKLYGPCKCSDHVRHVELVVQHGQFNVSHSTVTVDSHVRNTKPAVTACSVPLGIQFLGRLPCLNWPAVQTVCRQLG